MRFGDLLFSGIMVALCTCVVNAMVDDCMIYLDDGTVHPHIDNLHCGRGNNLLHDRVCRGGYCTDRYRVQHMRWEYGHLEYVVCRQSEGVSAQSADMVAELKCARDAGVNGGSVDFVRSFPIYLDVNECWIAPEKETTMLPLVGDDGVRGHELIVCEGRVRATSSVEVDIYKTAFVYDLPSYLRWY